MNAFTVTVNYGRSLRNSVKAGKYDWSNRHITAERFPSKRTGTANVEIILVKFENKMGFDDSVREIDNRGLRPVELPELLAFGGKYPNVQKRFPVVALGSVWHHPNGFRDIPFLNRCDDERTLDLCSCVYDWDPHSWFASLFRFAAIRK